MWRMPRKCPRQSPTDLRSVTDLRPQLMVSLMMATLAQRPPKVSSNPLKSKVAKTARRVPQQPNPLGAGHSSIPLLSFSFQHFLEVIQEAPGGPLADDLLRV